MYNKKFKNMQDCLFWIRYNLHPKSYYMGIPKILEIYGESDIHYPHDTLFCSRIRRKINLYVGGELRFTVTPMPKRLFFGIDKRGTGRDYIILFIPYPTYEKMLIDNIVLGLNYPLERKFDYDYNLLTEYLKKWMRKNESEMVLSRV